jgi:hypothetical protein
MAAQRMASRKPFDSQCCATGQSVITDRIRSKPGTGGLKPARRAEKRMKQRRKSDAVKPERSQRQ